MCAFGLRHLAALRLAVPVLPHAGFANVIAGGCMQQKHASCTAVLRSLHSQQPQAKGLLTRFSRRRSVLVWLTIVKARLAAAASSYLRRVSSSSARQRASKSLASFWYRGVPGRCSARRNCTEPCQRKMAADDQEDSKTETCHSNIDSAKVLVQHFTSCICLARASRAACISACCCARACARAKPLAARSSTCRCFSTLSCSCKVQLNVSAGLQLSDDSDCVKHVTRPEYCL